MIKPARMFFLFGYAAYFGLVLLGITTSAGCGGRNKEASEFYMAVKNRPNDPRAHIDLGMSYCHQEEYKQAVLSFNKALELDPKNADALFSLGVCYYQMGIFDKAMEQYRKLRLVDRDMANRLFEKLNGRG